MGSRRSPVVRGGAAAVAVWMAVAAHGQFTFTQQTRRVFAQAGAANFSGPGSSSQQQLIAPDFGPFNATANAAAGGTVGATADGRAEQVSSLLPGVISTSGLTRVGSKMGSASTYASGTASWDFIVSFTVTEPTPVHVSSLMQVVPVVGESLGQSDGWLEIKRDTATGPVLVLGGLFSAHAPVYSFSGPLMLEPGVHTATLQVRSFMGHIQHTYMQAQTSINLTISVVPAPAVSVAIAWVVALAACARRRGLPR